MGAREEAKRFAAARDTLFDKVKADAMGRLKAQIDPVSILQAPEQYMSIIFAKVGAEVVKAHMAEARRIGAKHGERFPKH
jgi:hypothetical protein